MSKCNRCGADILWIANSDTGEKIPVNKEEVAFHEDRRGGLQAICTDGSMRWGRVVGDAFEDGYLLGRVVHFGTCEGRRV